MFGSLQEGNPRGYCLRHRRYCTEDIMDDLVVGQTGDPREDILRWARGLNPKPYATGTRIIQIGEKSGQDK